jgi:hypothetical protein
MKCEGLENSKGCLRTSLANIWLRNGIIYGKHVRGKMNCRSNNGKN